MTKNTLKEIPVEVSNRIKSKAFMNFAEKFNVQSVGEVLSEKTKKAIIDLFIEKEEKLYLNNERQKDTFYEMCTSWSDKLKEVNQELAEAKEKIIKLQSPSK